MFFEPSQGWGEIHCLKPVPVRRSGSDRCWVQVQNDRDMTLCFSRAAWSGWLFSERSNAPCLETVALTRAYSIPHNLDSDPPKNLRITQEISGPLKSVNGPRPWLWRAWVALERWRERVSSRLAPADTTGVFRALLLQESTPGSPLGLYRQLGFVHLATAAGVHLYAIQRLWLALSYWIASAWGACPKRGRKVAQFLAWTSTLLAWALSGFRLGLLRPWLVIAFRALALNQGVRFRLFGPLSLSLALDLLVGTLRGEELGLHSGRWIYALAVGGAILTWENSKSSSLRSHVRMAVSSWTTTAVLEAWTTGLCAPLTPVLSLITLPLFCSYLYPALFLDSLAPSFPIEPILRTATVLLEQVFKVALLGPSLWVLPHWAILWGLGAGGALATLKWENKPIRAWVAAFTAAAVAWTVLGLAPRPHSTEVTQLDVGQGDAAFVRTASARETLRAGLVDTGPRLALRPERWLQLFAASDTTRLDWIALTHLDQDHASGLLELSRLLPIGCVEISGAEGATVRGTTLQTELRSAGIPVYVGCTSVPALHPPSDSSIPSKRPNARMSAYLVPLVRNGRRIGTYLSAGDADTADEPRIARWALNADWKRYPVRIFKISHHGSKTSSNPAIFRLLNPSEAWISAGAGNRYGHPQPIILERVRKLLPAQAPIRRTDEEGALGRDKYRKP